MQWGTVQGHEVTLEWEVVDGILAIEGRVGDEAAGGAAVEIRSDHGRIVASGKMDEAGRYEWPVTERGPITVVMRDGFGHRRTVTVSEAELRGVGANAAGGGGAGIPKALGLGLGLTFLLALAAAWMSYGNMRRLAALERRVRQHES
jgi:hypothetical protein